MKIIRQFAIVGAILVGLILTPQALGQDGDSVEFSTMTDVRAEQEAAKAQQMARLVGEYDLERWTFTREIVIESGAIPHSHPVLTLSTRGLDNDDASLATYIHEQLHWYLGSYEDEVSAAKAALSEIYPDLPIRGGQGARNEDSNYLHLIVNALEYRAIEELFGTERALAVLDSYRHYQALYDIILNDIERVEAVMAEHGIAHP